MTAWTDICSGNICTHYIHVDYAEGRAMLEQRSGVPRRPNRIGAVYVGLEQHQPNLLLILLS